MVSAMPDSPNGNRFQISGRTLRHASSRLLVAVRRRGQPDHLLSLAVLTIVVVGCRPAASPKKLEVRNGAYFWHSPYSAVDLPLDDIYVRVATLSYDGDRLSGILPIRFDAANKSSLTLVMNFDAGAVRHLEEVDLEETAEVIGRSYLQAEKTAQNQGALVRGLQLDIDCPTRLLPRYGELLEAVRRQIPGRELSITGLTSWIGDRRLSSALKPLDYWVPQFYEGRLPRAFEQDVAVTEDDEIKRKRRMLAELGTPFRLAIASYGQALLFDASGKPEGVFRSFGLEEAFRNPRFSVKSVRRVLEEIHIRFVGTDTEGRQHGILFRLPTAKSFSRAWSTAAAEMPPNFAGRILFRVPQEGEATTLPLVTLQAALAGKPTSARLTDVREEKTSVFGIIEGQADLPAGTTTVTFGNGGNAPRLEERPATIDLKFDEGCAETVSNSAADRLELLDAEGRPGKISLRRASGVRFTRWYLAPGDQKELGTVRLKAGCKASSVVNK